MNSFDIAVVGAGVSGTGAAIALAQCGARVTLLEAGAAARHKVCGEFLSPESRTVLEKLGVLEEIFAAGAIEISVARILTTHQRGRTMSLPRNGLAISRRALDGVLWHRAQHLGIEAREHTRVKSISQQADGNFSLQLPDGQIEARFVINAQGRGAKFSEECTPLKAAPQRRFLGIKTHLSGANLANGEVQLFPFSGGYCGLVGVENGLVNACALVDYKTAEGRAPAALWQFLQSKNQALMGAVAGAVPIFDWLATANIVFDRFLPAASSILRVGDAAGTIHPLTGDGMAMAARSGELAAHAVASALKWNLSPTQAGSDYGAMWHREFGKRLRWAHFLQPLLTNARVTRSAHIVFDHAPALGNLAIKRTRGY